MSKMEWPADQLKRLKSMLFIALAISSLICLPCVASAQIFEFSGTRQKDVINFTRVKNLIVIPVYINGTGPYNFLLDTGVGQMIITDTSLLKHLNVKSFKSYKIQGYGLGKEIEAILTRNITATVGNATIRNIPAAILKEDIFDLSSYLGMKIYGILGYYFFNSFIVRINYSNNKLIYYSRDAKVKRKGVRIRMPVLNAKPYIDAVISIDSLPPTRVRLLVDNGSSHPLLLESIDEKPFPLPRHTIQANLGVGINGEISGRMGRAKSLNLAHYTFNNILAGFPVFSTERIELDGNPRNGNLGAEVLKHFLVTFDYRNEALYLKKSNFFHQTFEHDMSGLEIYVLGPDKPRYFISRIEPGSPAEIAGLKTGDEIMTVDFKGMEDYTLNELTELFRDHDGKQMLLQIYRDDGQQLILLRLKRRI